VINFYVVDSQIAEKGLESHGSDCLIDIFCDDLAELLYFVLIGGMLLVVVEEGMGVGEVFEVPLPVLEGGDPLVELEGGNAADIFKGE